jgi:hypothetical protein
MSGRPTAGQRMRLRPIAVHKQLLSCVTRGAKHHF